MTEIKAKGLDEARAALESPYWPKPDHLRQALTVADTLAARLAEVERERATMLRLAGELLDALDGHRPAHVVYSDEGAMLTTDRVQHARRALRAALGGGK